MRPRSQADVLLARRHPRIKQVFEALLVEIANHLMNEYAMIRGGNTERKVTELFEAGLDSNSAKVLLAGGQMLGINFVPNPTSAYSPGSKGLLFLRAFKKESR